VPQRNDLSASDNGLRITTLPFGENGGNKLRCDRLKAAPVAPFTVSSIACIEEHEGLAR
jgi:hypothetical protein